MFDDNVKSGSNGFIDLWLERDKQLSVEITYMDKKTTGSISTFKGDDTCITTFNLK